MKTILLLAALLLAAPALPAAGGPAGHDGSAAQAQEPKTPPLVAPQPAVDYDLSDEATATSGVDCTPACKPGYACVPLLGGHTACVDRVTSARVSRARRPLAYLSFRTCSRSPGSAWAHTRSTTASSARASSATWARQISARRTRAATISKALRFAL